MEAKFAPASSTCSQFITPALDGRIVRTIGIGRAARQNWLTEPGLQHSQPLTLERIAAA
jgi:hypothetical protein